MLHALFARTKGLFEGTAREDDQADDPEDAVSSSLYSCPGCGRTYITESMESCSNCERPVERVPNEFELGILEN